MRLRWTRADSVIMQGVLLAVAFLVSLSTFVTLVWALFAVPSGLTGWLNQVPAHHTPHVPSAVPEVTVLADDAEIRSSEEVVLLFQDPGLRQRLLLAAPVLLWNALALAVVLVVLNLLRSLREGDPFVPANVRRVYTLAALVLFGSLLLPMVGAFCGIALRHGVVEPSEVALVSFTLNPGSGPLAGVLLSLVLVALAEVFRRGSQMRDDVDGLV